MSYKSLYFPKLKRRSNYSRYSHYRDYRQEIREDCQGRCIYCDVHENDLGGSEYMTIDHFRPKKLYPELQHAPHNLVWACSKCNSQKQNFWPAYGTPHTIVGKKGYIDPFIDNPHDYFEILLNGEFKALQHPARYMIKVLHLNRSGVKRIRALRNKRHEMMKQSEDVFKAAIKHADVLLTHSNLSDDDREAILEHKKYLRSQYELAMKSLEIDFNLY